MLFNSFDFLYFFLVVTTLYFILPYGWRWLLLLAASCYFYMVFVPIYILILLLTIIIDYVAGILIESVEGNKRKLFLACGLVTNIGILVFFKYFNFVNSNISSILHYLGYANPLPFLTILLPIGLSFHTFQAMSYTIEVFRGKQKAERHFGIYSLYVMFYPQLVAGPVERPQNILHQFYEKHSFDYKKVTDGLKLMLWGFFKKIVIADNLALVVNKVFDGYDHFKGLSIIVGTLAFAIQIYCDFSGYSDIAIGVAKIMGFDLMINFRRPYYAKSISEFWARWHISLSTWFRDYLYIPLGGNRVGFKKWCINILIVFILSGLWHGANWTFIIWGLLHGLYMVFGKITNAVKCKLNVEVGLPLPEPLTNFAKIAFTFIIVAFAWIFFRANNLNQAIYLVHNLFTSWRLSDIQKVLSVLGRGMFKKIVIGGFLLILGSVEFYQEKWGSVRLLLSKQPIAIRWLIYLILLFSIFLFGAFGNMHFIYFQF